MQYISKDRVFNSRALLTHRKQLTETWQFNLFDASQYSYATLYVASFAAVASYSHCVCACVASLHCLHQIEAFHIFNLYVIGQIHSCCLPLDVRVAFAFSFCFYVCAQKLCSNCHEEEHLLLLLWLLCLQLLL